METVGAAFAAAAVAFVCVWMVSGARGAAALWAGYRGVAASWPVVHATVAGIFVLIVCLAIGTARAETTVELSDDEVNAAIIVASVGDYIIHKGSCPCPWNLNNDGEPCGDTSADRRDGGADPVCRASDVTDEMRKGFRDSLRSR